MNALENVKYRFDTYRSLMPHRIGDILLVSSLYDAYVLEEDASLQELIWQQYTDRGLSSVPRIWKVTGIDQAVERVQSSPIDLVLTILHEEADPAHELAVRIKAARPDLPVVALATDPETVARLAQERCIDRAIDRLVLWRNDPSILLAVIKSFEDRANLANDTSLGGVRVILYVEDNPFHYSAIMPALYTAVMELTGRLMDQGLNHMHRQLRMRSRAKVIHVETYEEAVELYKRYQDNVLGVITDVRFWKDGALDPEAGFRLAEFLRRCYYRLPVCLLSSEPEPNRDRALAMGAAFIDKNSLHLLDDLQQYFMRYMGFGDFRFQLPDGTVVDRASSPRALVKKLAEAPLESVLYHARHQDFSHWMMARSEIAIAEQLYPRTVEDFSSGEEVRRYIIQVMRTVLHEKQSDVITHFTPDKDPHELEFLRLGEGSLGGKARGIGFIRYLIAGMELRKSFPDVSIEIPPTLVVCSAHFEKFVHENGLWDIGTDGRRSFEHIRAAFLEAPIDPALEADLRAFLMWVYEPLAVRSSSILEDSYHLPLAGMYDTLMLPNSNPSLEHRLEDLVQAVKLVWASTFGDDPKAYFRQAGHRLDDERMSVVVQTVCGKRHGQFYYPTFSGVAQSYNFYPVSYMKPEDGVAQIAMGMGKTVVEGGAIVRFCPQYPQLLPQFAQTRDWLYFTQKDFYALEVGDLLHGSEPASSESGDDSPDRLTLQPLSLAEEHGELQQVASVYQYDSGLLADSLFYEGPRIVTFSKVLKNPSLRLGELLSTLMHACEDAMRTPVEMEFAVTLGFNHKPVFSPLQLRPMTAKRRWGQVEITPEDRAGALCFSTQAHGNGRITTIRDIIHVRRDTFSTAASRDIADQIGVINNRLTAENRPYLLIGMGRWGSTDPEMGIAVRWSQIAGVRVLVEVGLEGYNVDPAQGTHFFQNITSLNIGCLTVPFGSKDDVLDWNWLERQPAQEETDYLRHLRLPEPLTVLIDGRSGTAVIRQGGNG